MTAFVRHLFAALGFVTALVASAPVTAQDFPNRPITWVVGFAPGGISDQGTRFIAKVFAEKLGQPVIVENKPGAAGIIAAEYVAQAKPDGYTILYGSSGPLGTYKSLYKKLSYDPLTSFTLIHAIGSSPMLLVVPESSPFKTAKELVEFAKRNPDKLNYGSVGNGSGQHLVAELFSNVAGMKMTHVPYKGSAPGLTDLLGGRLDLMFDYSIVLKPQIDAGKLRTLGSSGPVRLTSHPDVPTMAELGYAGVEFTAWATIVGPAGIPQPVVEKMARLFSETLKDASVVKYHADQGVTLMPDVGPDKLRDFIVREQAKMKDVIERSGASAE